MDVSYNKPRKSEKGIGGTFTAILIILLIGSFVWFVVKIALPNILPYINPEYDAISSVELPVEYEDIVEKYASEYDIPASVIYAVIYAESNFDNSAVSHAGAHGLMQITYDTFEWLETHLKDGAGTEDIYDPDVNIRYGSYYLSYLYGRFGEWRTAYAAYNAGIGSVCAWLEENDGVLGDIPYSETAHYVEKVANARIQYEKQLENENNNDNNN